jgi:hypothetical protein
MDVGTGRPLVEKWGQPSPGDVLDMDHRDAPGLGLGDGSFEVLKNDLRVPQGELASREVVILEINQQQCLGHVVPSSVNFG